MNRPRLDARRAAPRSVVARRARTTGRDGAEVQHLDCAVGPDLDIRGLQIAMNNPLTALDPKTGDIVATVELRDTAPDFASA